MRLLVRMFSFRPMVKMREGRWRRRQAPIPDVMFETTVVRIIGPVSGGLLSADGFLPEKYAAHALPHRFQPDGTYRFEVHANHNRKTLEPFFASGLLEMDVTEVES